MYVEELDIPLLKITEAAQRVLDRAVEEARRRDHSLLTSEHVFYALAQVEWDLFAQVMRDVDVNSVMLLGEPGVGKTAIAEGLAQRIEFEPEAIPVRLRDCQIINLQMNTMVAGTMLRGMFEDRMQNVIREVKERPKFVLFVDEAHTMIGAGSALGAPSDAANILKSVLARGEIQMIAATTLDEYKAHIQDDEALARRFRCVNVCEPTIEETRRILHHVRPRLERNYAVGLPDEALETALGLSPRYMRHLRLHDKVIGWLDTAAVRAEIDGRSEVKKDDVISVIADAAQIPKDMVYRDVTDLFRDIEAQLQRRVIGQTQAVSAVPRRLVLNKGPLKDGFDRPDGVLLFLGPTGVGKTELAKAVAAFLFGDEKKMVRIDMSEYQDGSVGANKLIGMPRGIVGSERGGVLTNELKDHPYTVVLLDEVEKASPSLLNVFLQAFDEGWLTDGRGKRVYLSDAVIIMTSNLGSEHFRRLTSPLGFLSQEVGIDQIRGEIMRELERRFPPEFRNRIDDVVLFGPLARDEVREIAGHYLATLEQTLTAAGKTLRVEDDALDLLASQGYSLAYGARFLKRIIDERVKLPISARWREGSLFHVRVRNGEVTVDVTSGGSRGCLIMPQPQFSPVLLTDLYELTMLQAYFEERMHEVAVFSLFVRRLPERRNYLMACGLDDVLAFLETLRFDQAALAYLDSLGRFSKRFLQYLEQLRFTGDVYAVPEGTPVFANEPLVEIEAPIAEAQLVETFVMNQVHLQTVLASKAARVVEAALGRQVVDFGLRRMHGTDAGLKAARAFHIAGVHATSNLAAGQAYGMPVTGTLAHSYIQAHDDEYEAFRAFARLYPDTVLLVDTYDTLAGVRKVVDLARELGPSFHISAVRLDSGDLGDLAFKARRLLDDAGLQRVTIFASGGLNEDEIAGLMVTGAPIDGFGVGTDMGVSRDAPSLDIAYKLVEYAGRARMKLSTGKVLLPGRKQIFRVERDGIADHDVLARRDDEPRGRPLLQHVMAGGRRCTAGRVTLNGARAHAKDELDRLPPRLRGLEPATPPYVVDLSPALTHDRDVLRRQHERERVHR